MAAHPPVKITPCRTPRALTVPRIRAAPCRSATQAIAASASSESDAAERRGAPGSDARPSAQLAHQPLPTVHAPQNHHANTVGRSRERMRRSEFPSSANVGRALTTMPTPASASSEMCTMTLPVIHPRCRGLRLVPASSVVQG